MKAFLTLKTIGEWNIRIAYYSKIALKHRLTILQGTSMRLEVCM